MGLLTLSLLCFLFVNSFCFRRVPLFFTFNPVSFDFSMYIHRTFSTFLSKTVIPTIYITCLIQFHFDNIIN